MYNAKSAFISSSPFLYIRVDKYIYYRYTLSKHGGVSLFRSSPAHHVHTSGKGGELCILN